MSRVPDNSAPAHPAGHHEHACAAEPVGRRRLNGIALAHASAVALQGLLIARFLDLGTSSAIGLFLGFGGVGAVLAALWRHWAGIPHALDMCFGMCTLGALGMYLGIWTDHRFRPMPPVDSLLWTYGFMLIACDAAMLAMTRHRHLVDFTNASFLAMFVGGNLGMIAGMKAGALLVTELVNAAQAVELLCKLAAMSLGMVVGMVLGDGAARLLTRTLRGKAHQ
jgi:hypothetical protein